MRRARRRPDAWPKSAAGPPTVRREPRTGSPTGRTPGPLAGCDIARRGLVERLRLDARARSRGRSITGKRFRRGDGTPPGDSRRGARCGGRGGRDVSSGTIAPDLAHGDALRADRCHRIVVAGRASGVRNGCGGRRRLVSGRRSRRLASSLCETSRTDEPRLAARRGRRSDPAEPCLVGRRVRQRSRCARGPEAFRRHSRRRVGKRGAFAQPTRRAREPCRTQPAPAEQRRARFVARAYPGARV